MKMRTKARTEEHAVYKVHPDGGEADDEIVRQALLILGRRLRTTGSVMDSPARVREYLTLRVGSLEHEEFGVMWLNTMHAVIHTEEMFRGTLAQTSVYPREVVKRALQHNAAAVIFYHNHPSGSTTPSTADISLTRALKEALALVDVRVLDHIIVGGPQTSSMAELGLV